VEKKTLGNGLPVLLVPVREVPAVEIALVVRSGAASDPAGQPGVATMAADMLDEGAAGKDALTLADALDFLGADLRTGASWDASTVRLHVTTARLREALPLMADVALRPDFPAKELERLRKEALTDLLQARDEPRRVAAVALDRAVFGEAHRYGQPLGGDARSVAALTVDHLRAYHQAHYRPANATLIVVGDVDAAVLPLLDAAFGSWPAGGATPGPLPEPRQVSGRGVWLVDKPGAPQSVVRLARVGPGRSTAEYHGLQVMNTLLGGSFTSRLNDNLREQHGYAYGAGSGFGYRRTAGAFTAAADVQTQSTADALREFIKELTRIRTPATPEEVERARNYLALGYAGDFETTRQIASQLVQQVVYGLPDDAFSTFVPKVLATRPEDVQRVASRWVDPARLAIVVVGDRKAVETGIRGLGLGPVKLLSVDDVMGPPPKIDGP
jgi:predicted Zn-dependent peptidase